MQLSGGQKQLLVMIVLSLVALLICMILALCMLISGATITNGCLLRYNIEDDGAFSTNESLVDSVFLKADANYTYLPGPDGLTLDLNSYGKWKNTGVFLEPGIVNKMQVKGEISLCKAYIPRNNLQQTSDLDISNERIEIPRIEDQGADPISLIFNAKEGNWRNIAELYPNDQVIIAISKDRKENSATTTGYDFFAKQAKLVDCSEGGTSYDPICGRYAIKASNYVKNCSSYDCSYTTSSTSCSTDNNDCYCNWFADDKATSGCNNQACRTFCDGLGVYYCAEHCSTTTTTHNRTCYRLNSSDYRSAPEPYYNDGSNTISWSNNISTLLPNLNPGCSSSSDYSFINGSSYQNKIKFWYSADEATGLLYRFDGNISPTSASSRGGTYAFAELLENQNEYNGFGDTNIILDYILAFNSPTKYLQYRMIDNDGQFADNTGGYVLHIKQTKCRRTDGEALTDTYPERGRIQYFISSKIDPNQAGSNVVPQDFIVTSNGEGNIVNNNDNYATLWLRIKNDPNDYVNSTGQYNIDIYRNETKPSFYESILTPLITTFKTTIMDASAAVFKNMTCYQSSPDAVCTNFFNYIRAILTAYIMIYGMMFTLGMTKITQKDLVMRVIKVGIVAGLINGKTFEFFNDYIFDLVTNFTDSIIANIGGYSLFTGGQNVSNPFMFLEVLFTQIFISKTFSAQMMVLPFIGIHGIFYFIIVFISLCLAVTAIIRSIGVYLMAFLAVALLMGLAPLFLTFLLFDRTYYLFEQWIKMLTQYLMEPVILLTGIIILTQLFTIYIDLILGYSVCWKCAIPFKLPFVSIAGMDETFLGKPLFCLNWFAPWGVTAGVDNIGFDMQVIIALMIIAYCLKGWVEFSSTMVSQLFGVLTAPSATSMGQQVEQGAKDGAKWVGDITGATAKAQQGISAVKNRISGEVKQGDAGGSSGRGVSSDNSGTSSNNQGSK